MFNGNSAIHLFVCNSNLQITIVVSSAYDLVLLVILHAQVAWTGNQHDTHILQRAFDDVHVLVQVAGWRLGGVRQEGIFKVHAKSLGEVMVPKRYSTLQQSKQTHT